MTATDQDQPIVIRVATAADYPALLRLAALDTAPAPTGRVLFAEVAGTPRAALSESDGHAVADPFSPSAELVALLRDHVERRRRRDRVHGGRRRAGDRRLRRLAAIGRSSPLPG